MLVYLHLNPVEAILLDHTNFLEFKDRKMCKLICAGIGVGDLEVKDIRALKYESYNINDIYTCIYIYSYYLLIVFVHFE